MNDIVIEAKNLTKRYRGIAVVKAISFSVARGEIFGLLGPNGAGKTTTILMMLGLTEISDGTVRVLDHNPVREPLAVKRRVGYLPDQVGFYDNLSASDNLRYIARLIGLDRAEREEKIASSLAHVGLADVADNRVGTFSRGMRQRLGLAEILMKDAEVAILDEPTSGLDPQVTVELLDIIRDLKHRGVSVLLSSHLLERVQSVCDRVALFNEGKIALLGTVPELGRQVLGGGFRVEVEAEGKLDAFGNDDRPEANHGVQLWIDTRDTRNVSRATRFCHRFDAKLLKTFTHNGAGGPREVGPGQPGRHRRAEGTDRAQGVPGPPVRRFDLGTGYPG